MLGGFLQVPAVEDPVHCVLHGQLLTRRRRLPRAMPDVPGAAL